MNLTVTRQMIGAEFLKLRRNRAIMAWTGLLTVGVTIISMTIVAILHAADPAGHAAAGGTHGFTEVITAGGLYSGAVAAIILGVTAGGADAASGVFRDLAATGRSRTSLFLVRVPGALAVLVPFVLVSAAFATVGGFVFAGGTSGPDIATIAGLTTWYVAATSFALMLAIGVASVLPSKAIGIGLLMSWQLALGYLIAQISFLGWLRQGISVVAVGNLLPSGTVQSTVASTLTTAVVVLVGWAAVVLGACLWRTRTMDA
jgi:hypothetical protein